MHDQDSAEIQTHHLWVISPWAFGYQDNTLNDLKLLGIV